MKQISNSHLRWPKGRRSCVKYISKERINNESMRRVKLLDVKMDLEQGVWQK